ncbi:gp5 C-terminal domain protein, partial [Vibrio parahaemolyticus EKP-021]
LAAVPRYKVVALGRATRWTSVVSQMAPTPWW